MADSTRKTITIDCDYLEPRFAAAYLLRDGDRAAFIDNNTAHSVPKLLQALRSEGLRPEQVEFVIITHVHLDHAGGTSALMRACPNATLLAHPRAMPHMIDPSKLVGSARKVYGDAQFEKLYGEIGPIDASRVRAMNDGEAVEFGSARLKFIHTRGHANHHMCILDEGTKSIFTGDSFGLCYPELQSRGLFIFPSTSPTDFDAPEARLSLDKIVGSGARTAYLTHFGGVTELKAAAQQLCEHLDFSEAILKEAETGPLPDTELQAFCEKKIREHFEALSQKRGGLLDARAWNVLKLDLELNAAGLAFVAQKRRAKKAPA